MESTTALVRACQLGHLELCRYLITPELGQADKDYLLRVATLAKQPEVIGILLDAGANVNTWDDWPLRTAAENGASALVQLLIKAGADPNAWHAEALRAAASQGHTVVVRLLLEAGARPANQSILIEASRNGHVEIVKLLIESRINTTSKDYVEITKLFAR